MKLYKIKLLGAFQRSTTVRGLLLGSHIDSLPTCTAIDDFWVIRLIYVLNRIGKLIV